MKLRSHLFIDHPASVGETYFEHMRHASAFGLEMLCAGLACLVHGIFPALFVKTGSRTVEKLHERMSRRSHGQASDEA